jgi:hypothetical protein
MSKDFKININWSLLQRIAEYYDFPLAVFLLPINKFPKGTRRQHWKIKLDKLRKILKDFQEEL